MGDFLDRTADQIADAQRALVKRNDPAAEAAAKEFEALRELL